MSRCLTERSIDHVVLERGEVANSWRTERWDSLRLLTPNWMTRLPGHRYHGRRPRRLHDRGRGRRLPRRLPHAHRRAGPDRAPPSSRSRRVDRGFRITTTTGRDRQLGRGRRDRSVQHTPHPGDRRRAADPDPPDHADPRTATPISSATVASSSSAPRPPALQIADELRRSGRDVTLAVGDHVRLPRTYRGMDIHWWMDAVGAARRALRRGGGHHAGPAAPVAAARRLARASARSTSTRCTPTASSSSADSPASPGTTAQFSGSFANFCASADLKLGRLLDAIDEYAPAHGLDAELDPHRPARPHHRARSPTPPIDLQPTRHRRLGDRLPARLPVARTRPARPQGCHPPRRRRHGPAAACTCSACRSLAAASRASSTASAPTPVELSAHLAHHLDATSDRTNSTLSANVPDRPRHHQPTTTPPPTTKKDSDHEHHRNHHRDQHHQPAGPTERNGVPVAKLRGTIAKLTENPDLAAFRFTATNTWVEGTATRSTIHEWYGAGSEQLHVAEFSATADHPTLGHGHGPTPQEYRPARARRVHRRRGRNNRRQPRDRPHQDRDPGARLDRRPRRTRHRPGRSQRLQQGRGGSRRRRRRST